MNSLTLMLILLGLLCLLALAGIFVKKGLLARLRDIDGWRGLHKRKDFKNKNIDKRK